MSEACYNRMLLIIKSMLPEDEKLPEDFYQSKKIMKKLGLSYQKIDICSNFCMLYYMNDSQKIECSVCGHPQLK